MTATLKDVLQGTKRIEALLEQKFGSTGRGLYEKMDSANMALPEPLKKRIRYVATLRNKAMHEDGFEIDDIAEYVKTCQSIAQQLDDLHTHRRPAPLRWRTGGGWVRKIFLLGCAGLGIFGLGYLGMATALKYEQPVVAAAAPPKPASPPPSAPSVQQKASPARPPVVAAKPKQAAVQPQADLRPAPASTDHPPAAPVTFKNLKFRVQNDSWGSMEPSASATFTNHHRTTISHVRVKMRLFINGEGTPVAGGQGRDGDFFVSFGDSGLAPGASAVGTLYFSGFDKDAWKVPDVVNAKKRVVEMKIIAAQDGRKNPVDMPNTAWRP